MIPERTRQVAVLELRSCLARDAGFATRGAARASESKRLDLRAARRRSVMGVPTKLPRMVVLWGALALCSVFVASPAQAKDRAYQSFDDWFYAEGFCYAHDEWSDNTPTLDARPDINYPGYAARPMPDLDCWLTAAHP